MSRGSKRFRRSEHYLGVALGFYLAPLGGEFSFGVDQERTALDTEDLLAVHILFADDIEELAQRLFFVGEQFVVQLFLGTKLLVRVAAVTRDADDLGIGATELRLQVDMDIKCTLAPCIRIRVEV